MYVHEQACLYTYIHTSTTYTHACVLMHLNKCIITHIQDVRVRVDALLCNICEVFRFELQVHIFVFIVFLGSAI